MRERIQSIHNPERKVFAIFIVLALLLCAAYGYFLHRAISNVMARENTLKEVASLDIRLNELEFSYIALQNSVSLEDAYERGFVDIEAPVFVSRTPLPKNLSLLEGGADEL